MVEKGVLNENLTVQCLWNPTILEEASLLPF